MGRKIPWDKAAGTREQPDHRSIVMPPNKYGYRIDINHPDVLPVYEAYKRKLGERILSDEQRLEFERRIFAVLEKKRKEGAI